MKEFFDDKLSHFDTISDRDGETDGQTDTFQQQIQRLCTASRCIERRQQPFWVYVAKVESKS